MRTYPLVCPCGWCGELRATAAERDGLRCPACKADARLETDYQRLGMRTEIEYGWGQGAATIVEGCMPKEVERYKRACPSLNVRPDGTFIINNRSHAKRVMREVAAFRGETT